MIDAGMIICIGASSGNGARAKENGNTIAPVKALTLIRIKNNFQLIVILKPNPSLI